MKKILLLILISTLLQSCASKFNRESFSNTRWILRTWSGHNLQSYPSLIFGEDSKFNGKSFCNSYGGKVSITEKSIKFERSFSTEKLCKESSGLENMYFKDLEETDSATILNGKLFLYKKSRLIMSFSEPR